MTVTSKFSKANAIITPISMVLCFGAIAYLIAFLSLEDLNSGKVASIFKTPIYGTVILVGIIIGIVHHYLKMCQTIQINNSGIKISSVFKSEVILWPEIAEIELTGKNYSTMPPREATVLKLKNGKQIAIVALYYENMPTIRRILEQVINRIHAKEPVEINPSKEFVKADPAGFSNLSGMTKYSGNHFLSFNGLIIYGWIALSIYFLMTMLIGSFNSTLGMILVTIGMSGFFYVFLGFQLHYYYVDSNHLVIKNHVWPWKKHVYRIENIKQVVLETPYKRPTSLRVITQDYNSRLYPAGSLRSRTWKELLREFENLKVDIRNETIF